MGGLFGRRLGRVDQDVGVFGRFVGVGDAGEGGDDSGAGAGVQALGVALLADLQGRGHVDEDEAAAGFHHLANLLAHFVVGGNRRAQGHAAVLGDLRRDEPDPADVQVPVLAREAQLARQVLANHVPVQQGHGAAPHLAELHHQRPGDRALAGARQAREEDREPSAAAGRHGAAQLRLDGRVGEPGRERQVLAQPASHLRARQMHGVRRAAVAPRGFARLAHGASLPVVAHFLERHHGHAQFGFVLLEQRLSFVGVVERGAGSVLARAGVVAAHDQVRAAVVLAHDGVPKRFSGTRHPHGQGQQRQQSDALGVGGHDRLVAPNPREVVQVPRQGLAHRGMHQQARRGLLDGADRQFDVGPVHGVPRLERHHATPAHAREERPKVGRRAAQRQVVVVDGGAHGLHPAADPDGSRAVAKPHRPRVLLPARDRPLGATREDGSRFRLGVRLPQVFRVERREQRALFVAQSHPVARRQPVRGPAAQVQRHGKRPQDAVGQAHLGQHPLVVRPGHEAPQGREPPVRQELQVAELPAGQLHRRPIPRRLQDLSPALGAGLQVHQRPPVGQDEPAAAHSAPPSSSPASSSSASAVADGPAAAAAAAM